jgi:hypothetical protein
VPAFHSTTCDQVHSPDWDADAGSSLVPVQQAQQTQPAHHAGVAALWLFGPVLDPRSKRVQRWNRWILLGRAAALAADPLFFYALSVGRAGRPCMYMDAGLAAAVTALRTFADVGHLGHVLLQFRLAYVSRESLVVGCGKLVWDARAIVAHYARSLKGLCFDLFVILPVPQVSHRLHPAVRLSPPPSTILLMNLTINILQTNVPKDPVRSSVGEGLTDQTYRNCGRLSCLLLRSSVLVGIAALGHTPTFRYTTV